MIKLLVSFFLLQSILFGCSICSIYSPRTEISISINADKEFIKDATFSWNFSKEFTDELLQLYDVNLDGTFDEVELGPIEDSLVTYVEPRNYLTFLSYSDTLEKETRLVDVQNYKLTFKKKLLKFEYVANLNLKIIDKNKLHIKIHDDEGYFIIFLNDVRQTFTMPYNFKKEIKQNSITYTIDAPNMISTEVKKVEIIQQLEEKVAEKTIANGIKEENLVVVQDEQKEVKTLDNFVQKIKQYLLAVEKGDDKYALVFLLFASFVYGVIHALGPGHGKALAFSYFSSRKSSYSQAFVISFFTAFIHIVGALVLVTISIFIIEGIFSSFLDDSILYITKTSAVLIMLLSLFILYRKLKKKSCACCNHTVVDTKQQGFSVVGTKQNFVNTNANVHQTTSNKNENLFFVLTAGLIPCPGTVLLFVYAFILKTYFSVLLASIFISLGMGIIIFASSFLGVSLHKVVKKSSKLTNFLEIASPIFMFILGLFLLLSWETI